MLPEQEINVFDCIYLLVFIHILKKYQEAENKQFTQIQSIRA